MTTIVLRVVLVDDHRVVLDALAQLVNLEPDMAVAGTADALPAAISLMNEVAPDVLVTDLHLDDDGSGWELIRHCRRSWPETAIVVLSMFDEEDHRARARALGVDDFVAKSVASQVLVDAIRRASEDRGRVRPPRATEGTPVSERLTDRELDVFRLLGRGYTTKEIAEALQIAVKTVETHRGHIMAKLALANSHQLIRRAVLWARNPSPEDRA